MGVSRESTNATVAPLLGLSSLICVPTAMVWSKISAITGCSPTLAKPVLHARPYLSLNPPILLGMDNTDLPVITSFIRFSDASSPDSPFWTAPWISCNHSHPSRLYCSIRFRSFFDLPINPSFSTRNAPPLTLSVLIRVMLRWLTTSSGSVPSPSSSTGKFEITVLISSSETWNWKLCFASLS